MPVSENLIVQLGQCGCQVGLAVWELFCLEHGLYPDGRLATEFGHTRKEAETSVFFNETARCKYVPRTLFFDFDVDVINDIRTGPYRQLFNLDMLVSGKEDAANNFARGFFTMGREFIECVMDKFRHQVESVDHLTGIMLIRSICGGTGSGFGSLVLQKIYQDYPKLPKVCLGANPSPRLSTAAVEPYNCVLSCHASMDYTDVDLIYENECCYSMFTRHLDVKCPSYRNINQLLAQVISAVTASFRFDGSMNATLAEFQTNLVPYPRIHYPLISYGPLIPYERVYHDRHSVRSLTNDVFEPSNQLVKCNPRKGKYMAVCILYRGDVTPNDVSEVIQEFKKSKCRANRMQFVDWSPGGFKVGICNQRPIAVPGSDIACGCRSVVGALNSTSLGVVWQRILKKFDLLFYRRAFVHWYVAEGMEEGEFSESRDNLETLMMDFHEIGLDSNAIKHEEYRGHADVDMHGHRH